MSNWKTEFEVELEQLVNKHSIENESDTPDFILARYIRGCLDNFSDTMKRRDKWNRGEGR
jgi:hypothetical protein